MQSQLIIIMSTRTVIDELTEYPFSCSKLSKHIEVRLREKFPAIDTSYGINPNPTTNYYEWAIRVDPSQSAEYIMDEIAKDVCLRVFCNTNDPCFLEFDVHLEPLELSNPSNPSITINAIKIVFKYVFVPIPEAVMSEYIILCSQYANHVAKKFKLVHTLPNLTHNLPLENNKSISTCKIVYKATYVDVTGHPGIRAYDVARMIVDDDATYNVYIKDEPGKRRIVIWYR